MARLKLERSTNVVFNLVKKILVLVKNKLKDMFVVKYYIGFAANIVIVAFYLSDLAELY